VPLLSGTRWLNGGAGRERLPEGENRRVDDYEPVMSFGEESAAAYDDVLRGDESEGVLFLERLADGGPVLELAIGTGRIALPLAARGVRVDGIDISPAMAAKLRAKEGGNCDCAKISTLTRSRSASMRSGSTLLATIR